MQREARNPGQLILSMSWRAKPLISYRAIVNLISATTTRTGVTVHFELDSNRYPKGIEVSDQERADINIKRAKFRGDWNHVMRANKHANPERALIS
jgi:hypothetical protein